MNKKLKSALRKTMTQMLADEFITSETDVLDKCITNITSRNIIICRLILCDIDMDIWDPDRSWDGKTILFR